MTDAPGTTYQVLIPDIVGGRRGSRVLLTTTDKAEAESLAEAMRQDGVKARIEPLFLKPKR